MVELLPVLRVIAAASSLLPSLPPFEFWGWVEAGTAFHVFAAGPAVLRIFGRMTFSLLNNEHGQIVTPAFFNLCRFFRSEIVKEHRVLVFICVITDSDLQLCCIIHACLFLLMRPVVV